MQHLSTREVDLRLKLERLRSLRSRAKKMRRLVAERKFKQLKREGIALRSLAQEFGIEELSKILQNSPWGSIKSTQEELEVLTRYHDIVFREIDRTLLERAHSKPLLQ